MVKVQSTGKYEILTMNLAPEDAFVSAASKVSPPTLSQYLDTKTFIIGQGLTKDVDGLTRQLDPPSPISHRLM